MDRGKCGGSGLSKARWEICWIKIFRLVEKNTSIVFRIRCSSVRKSSSVVSATLADFSALLFVYILDLTSPYFESDPPLRKLTSASFGSSRDKRSQRAQMVIGLMVTLEGLRLALA